MDPNQLAKTQTPIKKPSIPIPTSKLPSSIPTPGSTTGLFVLFFINSLFYFIQLYLLITSIWFKTTNAHCFDSATNYLSINNRW